MCPRWGQGSYNLFHSSYPSWLRVTPGDVHLPSCMSGLSHSEKEVTPVGAGGTRSGERQKEACQCVDLSTDNLQGRPKGTNSILCLNPSSPFIIDMIMGKSSELLSLSFSTCKMGITSTHDGGKDQIF